MNIEKYNVLGVMSGTSLDGVDLAQVHFYHNDGRWTFEIIKSETVAYDALWITKLKQAVNFTSEALEELNSGYTKLLSNIICDFIEKNKITALDAVCSHGHTILHQPQNKLTLQIGNLPEIASLTRQKVVCDFRVQDVSLGGQGAPLVPIGDQLLFSEFYYCMNLGGFSNVSFDHNGKRVAFDICPVNTVLNYYCNLLGFPYDDKGSISKQGDINLKLLSELNNLAYYKLQNPKSLGFEFVQETIIPIIDKHKIPAESKLRTFIEHIAQQTAIALPTKNGKIIVTGGGAYNEFLIERIQYHMPELQISIPSRKVIEFKEAVIFALLGVLKLRNEINVLSSVTGAIKDHCSGFVYN